MSVARRTYHLAILSLSAIAGSQAIELFVNRVLRPDREEVRWISDAALAVGLIVVGWLFLRLRETQIALTGLERQQIVAETQLSIAARVQRSLLPSIPKPSDGVRWCASVEPANKVGGDYFDFLPLPDGRMCVLLADVSGKGVAAAVFQANVRAIVRALAREATRPQELLSRVSSALLADASSGMYVTCIVAIVDPAARSMIYVNAGHPAGVVWSPRTARSLRVGGPPIGLLPGVQFEEETLAFASGELVVFMSDGVTEALDADSDTIVSVIAAQIEKIVRPTPETVCKTLLAAARQGPGPRGVEGWMDDRTVVAFGLLPEAG